LSGLSDSSLLKTLSLLQQQQQQPTMQSAVINEKSIETDEQKIDEVKDKNEMDEDITSDLVIAEEMPLSKSPEPTILSTDHKTEEINNSSNLIKNDILTTTKIQADQMQLKTNAGDSAGKSKKLFCDGTGFFTKHLRKSPKYEPLNEFFNFQILMC